jgi:hypothetical protein
LFSFVHIAYVGELDAIAMDVAKDREIIRLWNQLRFLEREGGSVATVRRQIERPLPSETVMQLDYVRREIERMRIQIARQRKEILQLQRAGISTSSAELLLARMHSKIDELCAERERLKAEQPFKPRALGGRSW